MDFNDKVDMFIWSTDDEFKQIFLNYKNGNIKIHQCNKNIIISKLVFTNMARYKALYEFNNSDWIIRPLTLERIFCQIINSGLKHSESAKKFFNELIVYIHSDCRNIWIIKMSYVHKVPWMRNWIQCDKTKKPSILNIVQLLRLLNDVEGNESLKFGFSRNIIYISDNVIEEMIFYNTILQKKLALATNFDDRLVILPKITDYINKYKNKLIIN